MHTVRRKEEDQAITCNQCGQRMMKEMGQDKAIVDIRHAYNTLPANLVTLEQKEAYLVNRLIQ